MFNFFNKKQLIVFTSCDSVYFNRHFIALSRSIEKNCHGIDLWVNLINPSKADRSKIRKIKTECKVTKIRYSFEYSNFKDCDEEFKRTYYASSKYVKLHKILYRVKADILSLDVDSLIISKLGKLSSIMSLFNYDIAVISRLKERKEESKFATGTLYVRNTKSAKKFISKFAYEINKSLQQKKSKWFLDQKTFYRIYEKNKKNIKLYKLPPKYADWEFKNSSVIWAGKGSRKYQNNYYLALEASFDKTEDKPKIIFNKGKKQLNVAVFLPQLDLPFKKPKIEQSEKDRKKRMASDTGKLREYWQEFAEKTVQAFNEAGHKAELIVKPMWEITPDLVNSYNLDLAFIPHKQYYQFRGVKCNVYYYMQVIFRWLFSCDHWGWSAGNSLYPNDYSEGNENSSIFELYKNKLENTNVSKFQQSERCSKKELIESKQIPDKDYIFFPCQIPNDQSIQFFSDFEEKDIIKALVKWSKKSKIPIVFKAHPVNLKSCKSFRKIAKGKNIYWSDASIHDLVSYGKAVYTINSGVGFEAMFYNKPIVTFGKIEYDAVTIHANLNNLKEVWQKVLDTNEEFSLKNYKKFVDWYCRMFCVDLSSNHANNRIQALIKKIIMDLTNNINIIK